MLVRYFLGCFFARNFLFLGILITIFAACNVFIRLPFLYSIGAVPSLVWAMLPLVIQFALPLASSLATSTTMMQHTAHDELLLLSFITSTRRGLWCAVLIFSVVLACLYGFLILELVPQGYKRGKELLLKVTREHFMQLEPHKFHTPLPGSALFFKKKSYSRSADTVFDDIVLAFDLKKDSSEQCFFAAKKGSLVGDCLILTDGSMYTTDNGSIHAAHFDQSQIDLARLAGTEKDNPLTTHHKFLTVAQLWERHAVHQDARVELYKRSAQIIWQFFLPILSYLLSVALYQQTLAACIGLCGVLYLLSYVVITFAQAFGHSILMMLFLYGPLLILFALSYYWYQKRLV